AATLVRPRKETSMFRQPRVRFVLLSTLAALALLLTSPAATGASTSAATTSSPAGAASMTAAPPCAPATDFDPSNFSNPTRIDNRWLPLIPGTQSILEGSANRGGGTQPNRVVFPATNLTKVIKGVSPVVVWDRAINGGQSQ